MMTSLGSDRSWATRDKGLPVPTQTSQPQKQLQATAEQIRLAQMICDKSDADFEDKVKQLMEVTGKNQDESMVALHDCNEDVNRAINFLLEGSSDTTLWETVGKKRSLVKEASSSESKENREKKGEKEGSRARVGPNRRARGTSRNRPGEGGPSGGSGARIQPLSLKTNASGGRGRGRAPGASRFSSQGMGTFNPADYPTDAERGSAQTGPADAAEGPVAWKSPLEDWTEDMSLSEAQVFTSSCAPAAENHVTPGKSLDLASLLQKPGGAEELGGLGTPSSQTLGHSLVFTNSHHHLHPARNEVNTTGAASYAHATLSSVLGSGFGDLGSSKLSSLAGAQILEQLKGPGLGQLTAQLPSPGSLSSSVTGTAVSTWDMKPPEAQSAPPLTSQFSREFKMQPEPSRVLSQLTQRQQNSLAHVGPLPQARQPSPPSPGGLQPFPKPQEPALNPSGASGGAKLIPLVSAGPDPQGGPAQHRQMKTHKRRIPPTSKIPSSAVEMPGSADVSGLNVQFGALDFGSEPALQDFGQLENCSSGPTREAGPGPGPVLVPQTQSSLYSKPISESLAGPLPLSLATSDPGYPSPSVSLPSLLSSLTNPSPATPAAGNSLDCGAPPHSRLAFSQGKEAANPVTNGYSGVRTPASLETSSSSTPKPESPSLSSTTPSAHLPPSIPPHTSALPSLAPELPSASLSPHSSHVSSGHASVSALCSSSSLTYTSLDSVSALAPSSVSFPAPAHPSSSVSSALNVSTGLHGTGVLGLSANGSPMASACRSAPLISSSTGKAPPNLSQGVPPLLPNQYIMGPGGLLPAYPQIYGYEDLHLLQSRLPMPSLQDYYGITFPGPTALSGRDGSLANNPYSGEVPKFGRGDSTSPAPPTSLSAGHGPQASQPQQGQGQGQSQPQPPQHSHHSAQQAFLNATLPPGYSYTGLPYYPGVPSAFQYGPTMFVPPASAKQHGVALSNPSAPFQQPSGYGQHTFSSGYDDLTQGPAGADYSKGYSNSSQAQAKSAASGPGKGVSVSSSNSGVPDISGTIYNKTQSFDKQGFHAGTPPPFNLPSALGGTGPLNPGGAPGYPGAPFLHILPAHQQPHSQLLHHHLAQDGQGGPSQRSQASSMQQKTQVNKSTYGSSPYWGN